jgi:hypothetical protein
MRKKNRSDLIVNTNNSTVEEAGVRAAPAWKGLYRTGGVCLFLIGVIYIACSLISIVQGSPPVTDSEPYLKSLATHSVSARITFRLFALTDFLLLPAVLALYLALRQIARNAMLVAVALMILFIVLDLAITEMNSLTLVKLTRHYAASTTDMQRSAYTAAEDYALATLPLATFYSFVVSSIGLLIVSVVMLKGVFSRPTAYAGIVASIEGIVGGFYVLLPALALLLIPCLIAFGIWSLLAGLRLCKLGNTMLT